MSESNRRVVVGLVLRDSALWFSRTTNAFAVEGIAKPLVCGQRFNHERPDLEFFGSGFRFDIRGAHVLSLALLSAEFNRSVASDRCTGEPH